MPSDDPAFDGTAAHGPAPRSVEKQWRRIMLSVGNQQHNLENPSGAHLAPPPQAQTRQNGFNPWAGRRDSANWPAGFELIPDPFS